MKIFLDDLGGMSMKKLFVVFALMSIALACNKENSIQEQQDETTPGTYTFTLTASGSAITRTSYAGEKTFSWDANDEISVLFHNGETHEFKTLKTTTGGNPAIFSGSIPVGWEVGASATESVNAQYWALFPAGAHVWDTEKHRPKFNIPAVTDFTSADHFSVNIPMQARGDNTSFTFRHAACAYKITFKNVDASTVRLKVTHGETHALSGSFSMENSGSNPGLWAMYADAGSEGQSVSFIKSVAGDKTVDFYFTLPRYGEDHFQPSITLTDEDTGFILYRGTAKSDWTGIASLAPQYDRMVLLPQIPAPGTGVPFIYAYGIDWDSVPAAATGVGNGAITTVKAAADESYFYLYMELDSNNLLTDDSYKYANQLTLYVGTEGSSNTSWMWNTTANGNNTYTKSVSPAWLMYNGKPKVSGSGYNILNEAHIATIGDTYYYEIKFNRDNTSIDLTSSNYLHLGALIYYQKYHDGTSSGSLGDGYWYSPYGAESLLIVSLPTYVAP